MYVFVIGDWFKLFIVVIVFMCMFGIIIMVIDGYLWVNNEVLCILLGRKESLVVSLNIWMIVVVVIGIIIIFFFMSDVVKLFLFVMICFFVFILIFGWLNFLFVLKGEYWVKGGLFWLVVVGLIYLIGFMLFFIVYEFGWI